MNDTDPSATAHVVARGVLFTSCDRELGALVPRGAAEASLRFLEPDEQRSEKLLRTMRQGWYRSLLRAMERIAIPGIALHYVLRKRRIEEIVRRRIDEGYAQVVNIGAGLDSLAFRLHREYPETSFIEIDHPATQRRKKLGLEALGGAAENFHLIPLDLTRSPLAVTLLSSDIYDRATSTIFIAEGLTMYLSADENAGILRFINGGSGPGSCYLFTFMERHAGEISFRNGTRLVDWWLRMKGEPFRWGIARRDLQSWLADTGFALDEVTDASMLRERYLAPIGQNDAPLAEGECIAEARLAVYG